MGSSSTRFVGDPAILSRSLLSFTSSTLVKLSLY